MKIKNYLYNNVLQGLKTSPKNPPLKAIILIPFYIIFTLIVGFETNLLEYKPITSSIIFILPISLFIFPSLLEEIFFIGVLLPYNLKYKNLKTIIFYILLSTILYTSIHLIYAWLNPVSAIYFSNIYFLSIVFFLGLTCSVAYVYSQSLWLPVIIHWLTVLTWVILLNGRNLILES